MCHGVGMITDEIFTGMVGWPCPKCGGSGVVHCCEGECAQPELEDDHAPRPPIYPAEWLENEEINE